MANDHRIFNRRRVRAHRNRAAAAFADHDFLLRAMAERLSDRLPDITRTFPLALDLGAHNGLLADYLPPQAGIELLVQSDLSEAMLAIPSPVGGGLGWGRHAVEPNDQSEQAGPPPNLPPTGGGTLRIVADEEFLPFAQNSFDLVMSAGSLHWVNDVPGALIQINRALKPDGLFLAMIPGGETLRELRQSFEQAELAISGGISPRISPFIDVKDAGALLQRAGFSLPVTDSETLTVMYDHPLKLLKDLRGMGEANAMLKSSPHFTRGSVLLAAMEYYQTHFANADGKIYATFELVTLTGWKPHAG